ncbi:acylneuraminate cytidylyltransferase [Leptolyngbya sp. 'hensonii']|uniref:cytidylyltransferase domain-containing protein n=1 Tax=Leptolyngbya sp. 'hensonii' TaxID=1922337 RepID=UPI00094FFE0D|nr:glycosyltransferase family protein [Leptolyngbya sp. 'hensonii']OLP15642.1 acylneuraminate cytidylyltransferase [Leptolyngbya sp. 'hensonii']
MKVVIIVQARMTSTRLPGKVLLPVLGKPLLEYQLERLQRVTLADQVVVATTTNGTDQPIVDLCDRLGVPSFRGSELDVLGRYAGAALAFGAEGVVRVTSDCPLIDPLVIDQVIRLDREQPDDYDYVANVSELVRTYPRGMDTEVFRAERLYQADREATLEPDREHVTPYIIRHAPEERRGLVRYDRDESRHRWTVDTPEDFELIRRMLEVLIPVKPEFTLEDGLALLSRYPEWGEINAHVEQKQYGQ